MIPACDSIVQVSVMGNRMGMMGRERPSATLKSAADLERTTGLEPATLTLAKKVMGTVRTFRALRPVRAFFRPLRTFRRVRSAPPVIV